MLSTIGGIRSVTATDIIQFAMIVIAIPMIDNIGLIEIARYKMLIDKIPIEKLDPTLISKETLILGIIVFFIKCIPFEMPAMIQRLLMARNTKQIQNSMRIVAMIDFPFMLITSTLGLVLLVLYPNAVPNSVVTLINYESYTSINKKCNCSWPLIHYHVHS